MIELRQYSRQLMLNEEKEDVEINLDCKDSIKLWMFYHNRCTSMKMLTTPAYRKLIYRSKISQEMSAIKLGIVLGQSRAFLLLTRIKLTKTNI